MFFSRKSKEERQAKAQERLAVIQSKMMKMQMPIQAISGHMNVTMGNRSLIMMQEEEGIVTFKHIPGRFIYTGYEYGDKSERSIGKAAAGALIGGALTGGAGAIVGAAIGGRKKDLSRANLYFIKEDTGKEFELTIQCDASQHRTLGRFLVAPPSLLPSNGEEAAEGFSEAAELVKFKVLLEEGIITEEEFNAKKKQIIGI